MLLVCLSQFELLAVARNTEIFGLGVKDRSFVEFSRQDNRRDPIIYRVGVSSAAKDWPAFQPGSFDLAVARSTMQEDWVTGSTRKKATQGDDGTFQIVFTLGSNPKGSFLLRLDAIFRYRRPAAPRYVLTLNGKAAGSYQLSPRPAPELWWPTGGEGDGNLQYFGYESVTITLPASLFVRGTNVLGMRCTEGFGIYYDHLSLENKPHGAAPDITEAFIAPTILYKNRPTGLVELARIHVRTSKPLGRTELTFAIGSFRGKVEMNQDESGDFDSLVEVPAIDQGQEATLSASGIKHVLYRGRFVPCRKWRVYALPMEQADFGYNDLPARTLEWENRFIDKALTIQKQYPSYAFTLDAAANLESYLATRNGHGEQLLDYLRSGKWGMNALYANFFTGLASPEELFQMLRYSQRASRQHGFLLDSASQTDEPSITWALPQVLASAGIKYFANGSDPIRGALNPIGLLNFHSPFYWEAANGSRVLTWSGVSYTAVDDMTWGGWNEASVDSGIYSPSVFGLTRSLPLFLSQYERLDFPFDAVLLFGLHNDEIPMRHWGDADVVEAWNHEYAFPKIIVGTQRDFFTHITTNFGSQIRTIRGDGGAYWEDEAGADARIAAIIRTSQNQLVSAEKFESLAHWLQPHLKFERSAFDLAWTNIMLADSYVWSDANSFRRPYSDRTRHGEAAHRAWAEAAYQQTSDLRLVAADKLAELVDTKDQGFVVLNPESWERSDFFDIELEPDEVLIDPATQQQIPCASMESLNGYQRVRCWAASVPAMGYRFYSTGKGDVPVGEAVPLDLATPEIENKHYKLQLDTVTGAIVHLLDKETGSDLVNGQSGYRLNEYLYVTGGDPGDFIPGSLKDNRILAADVTLPLPQLEIKRAMLKEPPVARRYPWGFEIVIRSTAPNTSELVSTITLMDLRKQVNICNEVHKVSTLKKEAIYFAFPFALSQPQVKYKGATAWVDPEKDMLPGANRQWFATQGGVWAGGTNNTVAWATVDAPLITLDDINRGLWPPSLEIRSGTVFSYVMNNYWYTDTPAQQGGHFTFRYALTSGPNVSSTVATTLASDVRSPLVAVRRYSMGWVANQPAEGTSFLTASPEDARVLTIRPMDQPGAYLIRVQNSNPNSIDANLQIPGIALDDAFAASPVGDRSGPLEWTSHSVILHMRAFDIQTIVVHLGRGSALSSRE